MKDGLIMYKRKISLKILLILIAILSPVMIARTATANEAETENRSVIAIGTVGENGAPWTLYDDDIVEVGGGEIPASFDNTGTISICNSPWYEYQELVRRIYFTEPVIARERLHGLFSCLPRLTHIVNAHHIDTALVTNMSRMFTGTESLTYVDVSSWNVSNVTDMLGMFRGTRSLAELDVSNWNTGNVISMTDMFAGARSLTELDVSNWNTSNVTNMSFMFINAFRLESLDVSNWDVSSVTNMREMFQTASGLTSLDVSNWDMNNVTNIQRMFAGARSLTELDVSNWDTRNMIEMAMAFRDTSNLTSLDLSNWDTII